MTVEHLEIERKFDVDEAFALPDLVGVAGVAEVRAPVKHALEATYYDTADLRLARARVTLRRRTGGADAGWHVKLPASAGARRELHSPLGRAQKTPPKAVLAPVLGIVRRAPVTQVASLRTHRLVTELVDADGRVLAEVADDRVTGTALPAGPGEAAVVTVWREVEVELVDGDEELLAAVSAAVLEAGARPADSPSKLSRVLADRMSAVEGPVLPLAETSRPVEQAEPGRSGKKGKGKKKAAKEEEEEAGRGRTSSAPAGEVVRAALQLQVRALQDADLMVRTGQPDGVHQVRVACRRLRSIFSSFRRVLDRAATDPLRDELSWLAGELSAARDDEVALAHLRELVAAQPVEQVLGPVAARLQQAEIRTARAGHERALETLSDARYLRLLDDLYALLAAPSLSDKADRKARPVLRAAVRKAARRLDARLERVDATDGPDKDAAVHEVRKAGKRLRYTAEVARADLGKPAKKLVKVSKKVQQALGDRQDTVVTREQCRQLAIAANAAGESTFTYGRLQALEETRANESWAEFEALEPDLHAALVAVTRKN